MASVIVTTPVLLPDVTNLPVKHPVSRGGAGQQENLRPAQFSLHYEKRVNQSATAMPITVG